MSGITLDRLQIFLAVAEYLHFTRAAESLYLTQPAVSAAIQSLEDSYGLRLFHRIGRRVELTDAGRLLQAEARDILDRVALTERGLRELNEMQRGELHLGSSLTIGNYWLPRKIGEFKRRHPGIVVNCTLANTEEICTGTATGAFDLGLIEGEVLPSTQRHLEKAIVGGDRLVIVVGPSHPWFELPFVETHQLAETAWLMREPGSGTQQRFEEALLSWQVDPSSLPIALVLTTGEMVKVLVEEGVGAAAISELIVEKELQLRTMCAVQIIDPEQSSVLEIRRPFLKLRHRQRFQTKISRVFEQLLVSY
jgi:DNA-binding transcriptional LysR family regulator